MAGDVDVCIYGLLDYVFVGMHLGRYLWCIDHIPLRFLSTLRVSARSIATVTTFCPFSSLTIVVTDIDGDGDAAEDGGGICSLLPDCARSSMVEKLLNVDLSRLEDGDMLMPVSQIQSPQDHFTLTSERSLPRPHPVAAV